MAIYGTMILTNKGIALKAKAEAGTALVFTKMKIGSTQLTTQDPLTFNDLLAPFATFSITSIAITSNTAHIKSVYENGALATSKYSCEIGLFANDPTDGEILYAYANAGASGDNIPSISSGPFAKQYQINVAIGSASSVTANVPAGVYAPVNSPTFTGPVTLGQAPTADLQAATKKYVDDEVLKAKKYAP